MVNVAIPGGSSALGTSIVNALLATSGRHTPVILSRHKSGLNKKSISPLGVEIRYVDYSDHQSLVEALQGVHTLISTLHVSTPQDWVTFHVNLINAAKELGVKRFAPSEWSLGVRAYPKLEISTPKIQVWEAVKASGLEGTRFNCGLFMDYLAVGSAYSQRDAPATFREPPYLFHFADGWVEIPTKQDGSSPRVSLTAIDDIGKFVSASLDLTEWPEELDMIGETIRLDQVVEEAEKVLGMSLRVRRLDKTDTQKRLDAVDPKDFIGVMESQLSLIYHDDNDGEGALNPVLNELCPDVKPMKVREFLEKCWN
ncbi:hypothetical protein FQN54_005186 [Arachnomyces sp. PD_36]|nr:hypothetical protein FQN54_005186 [Arachnomyces sp. PD_36]